MDMVGLNCDINHNKSIIINGRNDKDANLQNHIKFGKVISALMQKRKKFLCAILFPVAHNFHPCSSYKVKTFITYSFEGNIDK